MRGPGPSEQLPLAIQRLADMDFSEYVPGVNAEAAAVIQAWALSPRERPDTSFLYLCGASGTGKTHLLQAACRAALQAGLRSAYLPLGHPALDTSVFEELEGLDRIALDDLDAIAGQPAWEQALFQLYNRLRESRRGLLVAAKLPPLELGLKLPDLISRLSWGPLYQIKPLDEQGCAEMLRLAAGRRGLPLGEAAIGYLLRRCPREPGYLLDFLDQLDQASLIQKRRPTLALIRSLLVARDPGSGVEPKTHPGPRPGPTGEVPQADRGEPPPFDGRLG